MAKLKGGRVGSVATLKKKLKKGGGSGERMAVIPSDGSLTVRFITEPEEWVEFFQHYDSSRSGSYYFPCIENCPESHEGEDKPSKRYLANAVDTQEGKVVPLVLPASVASSLVKKYDKYKTLLDRDYEISRTGTGFDTEYEVDAEPASKMNLSRFDPLDLEALLAAQLEEPEDDDEEEVKSSKPNPKKGVKTRRKPAPIETDDDDEDDDDDSDEDEDEVPPRRTVKRTTTKAAPKAAVRKTIRRKR